MERGAAADDSGRMDPAPDIVKVFFEEPVGLEALAADDDPDARRRAADVGSLEALLAPAAPPYARLYLAGTALGAAPPRVGLTALASVDAWRPALLDWAGSRPWLRVGADAGGAVGADEAASTLAAPGGALALALGDVPPDALAEAARGEHRDALPALRRVLDAAPDAAVLFPEPAHDGHDWSVFARAPLREPFVGALRRHPAPPGVRRFVAPYRRARGEHTFYFEQWALDALDRKSVV